MEIFQEGVLSMERLTKRILCNPDGTIYLKRSNDEVVLIGKSEAIIETEVGFDPIDKQKGNYESMDEMLFFAQEEAVDRGWETELDY
ncbi:hypothetical protein [Bacillus sp. FJAT-50079]|uniref:hypothetical protein n=1 Tax=Bacillus sp. FJAT-50079 TaxID=2833577 RepID=UPI001BC97C66|nr:hypothetical protein [Bacillus sp. FJAT-50079]MBS4209209.1 hypothetical protein [Bacillus sp. FJAT-50079]